jgi:HEAT repeat protein
VDLSKFCKEAQSWHFPILMEVIMWRPLPVRCILACCFVTLSSAAEEPSLKEQSVQALIEQLRDKDAEKVCAAAKALGKFGPAAKDATPVLKEMLKDRNGSIRWSAAEALWRLHHQPGELEPVYAELLTAANPEVRAASAWRLGRFANPTRATVLLLASALRDEYLEVRVQAGLALANLGPNAEAALPALIRALGDDRLDALHAKEGWRSVRYSPALPALVEMPEVAIPQLIATFSRRASSGGPFTEDDPRDWQVPSRAAHALPAFGGRAVPPLLKALDARDAETRRLATVALHEMTEIKGLPETAVVKLEKCLDDPEPRVRAHAARVMAWLRPSSTKAVAVLEQARKTIHVSSTDLLADLGRMSPHNPAARKILLGMLGDDDAKTVREAYRILESLDLPADQVLGTWTRALAHADPEVRSRAIGALWTLGPAARPAVARLRERLTKEEKDFRAYILQALVAIDPDDPTLVPLLIKSMQDPDSYVRVTVIRTLAELGPRAKAALPEIEAHLLNPGPKDAKRSWYDSYVAALAGAIVRIAPGSADAPATLLKALRQPAIRSVIGAKNSFYLRDILEDGLQTYLPTAAPKLRAALADKDEEVRQSVALVLVRAGLEIDTALPVLLEKLWTEPDSSPEKGRFQSRVIGVLMRRRTRMTPAVVAAACKAWQTAGPRAREVLEYGLLKLQPEALPHLLRQLRQADTPKARRDLAHLLTHFEGQAKVVLPILLDELGDADFAAQYAAMKRLLQLGPDGADAVPDLVRLLGSPRLETRMVAAKTLGHIGRAARPAVPTLRAMLKEARPPVRLLAAEALSRIDPTVSEALHPLVAEFARPEDSSFRGNLRIELPKGLPDSDISVESLPESIARFGERAVLALAELLDNTDLDEWSAKSSSAQCGAKERLQAAKLLADLGPEAKAAVPALVRALKDKDPFIREAAAGALGRIGPAAKEAAPDLITLVEQRNRAASSAGAWVVGERRSSRFDGASRSTYRDTFDFRTAGREQVDDWIPFGYAFEDDPFSGIRPRYPYDPVYVLSRIDTETRLALPLLKEMARDPANPARLTAALAVWRSGGQSRELVAALTDALEAHIRSPKNDGIPLSTELRECLAELGTELKPALPALVGWLENPGWTTELDDPVAVAEAIGRLGPAASTATGHLAALIQGHRWGTRGSGAIALALFRIGGDKEMVFGVLREILAGEEERGGFYYQPDMTRTARVYAVRALGVLAENGDDRARQLVVETAKGDENPHVRVAALEGLARLKQANPDAMTGLTALLRHADAQVRVAAASALGRLGSRAKMSRPALAAATEDGSLAVRQAARQALELLE